MAQARQNERSSSLEKIGLTKNVMASVPLLVYEEPQRAIGSEGASTTQHFSTRLLDSTLDDQAYCHADSGRRSQNIHSKSFLSNRIENRFDDTNDKFLATSSIRLAPLVLDSRRQRTPPPSNSRNITEDSHFRERDMGRIFDRRLTEHLVQPASNAANEMRQLFHEWEMDVEKKIEREMTNLGRLTKAQQKGPNGKENELAKQPEDAKIANGKTHAQLTDLRNQLKRAKTQAEDSRKTTEQLQAWVDRLQCEVAVQRGRLALDKALDKARNDREIFKNQKTQATLKLQTRKNFYSDTIANRRFSCNDSGKSDVLSSRSGSEGVKRAYWTDQPQPVTSPASSKSSQLSQTHCDMQKTWASFKDRLDNEQRQKLSEYEHEIQKLQRALDDTKRDLVLSQAKVRELELSREDYESGFRCELDNLKRIESDLRRRLQDTEENLRRSQEENRTLTRDFNNCQQENNRLDKQRNINEEKHRNELQSYRDEMQKTWASCKDRLDNEHRQKLSQNEREIQNLQRALDDTKRDLSLAQAKVRELELRRADYEHRVRDELQRTVMEKCRAMVLEIAPDRPIPPSNFSIPPRYRSTSTSGPGPSASNKENEARVDDRPSFNNKKKELASSLKLIF